ncbi:hypothetical protein BO94DRAFT_593231 [Aspergillus sclerotioniger CBS 115572]|uniref:Methyltransferase n=1 Tax=Aspergillus sclerotioniger CBS 115572 TaxID=1450535 RepID=A0A317WYK2_9EURO|nr:hypothetical protein BO94DRAFT_593231 [Aspergillus sclerotioniger CBS 115572]PWY90412.1 hypothetical protein BO94DRAFT_593231 [Aspergillus sclerotioniger CBS 115572]
MKHDIQTELVFRKRTKNRHQIVDLTTMTPEEYAPIEQTKQEKHSVLVHDIRGEEYKYTLDTNGFQYIRDEVLELRGCSDDEEIKKILLPETEHLVQKITGASRTITFANRIRCFSTDENQMAASQAPARSVHSDFSVAGAWHLLESVITDPTELATLKKGRVLVINVWRPLKTIRKDPLAVCDWSSVDLQNDWISTRMVFPHGWNELGNLCYGEQQKWCYLSGQTPEEPLVFKQFDSAESGNGGMMVPHTAFEDGDTVGCEPRVSIEIKMFAFVPERG